MTSKTDLSAIKARWSAGDHCFGQEDIGILLKHIAELERANRTRPEYDLRCDQCGRAHILDTSIPSEIWNKIAPDGGVLCTTCIDDRMAAMGLKGEAKFYFVGKALVSTLYPGDADEPGALPSAWIRGHTMHTDAGMEYDEEVVPGSDRPPGKDWHPLYSRPSSPPSGERPSGCECPDTCCHWDAWKREKARADQLESRLAQPASALLDELRNRMECHFQPCASYWTTDDDMTEHFDPKLCDCKLGASSTKEVRRCRQCNAILPDHWSFSYCPGCRAGQTGVAGETSDG